MFGQNQDADPLTSMQELTTDRFQACSAHQRGPCPFCGASDQCDHEVARFQGGSARLEGGLSELRESIGKLIDAGRRTVAEDAPRPLAFRFLPGGELLLERLEAAWGALAMHARHDGDLDGWLAVLAADTDTHVANWLAQCIWACGDAPVVSADGDGVESWYCADPAGLKERLEAGLAGNRMIDAAADPLRLAG